MSIKIIVHQAHYGPVFYDASTQELEDGALMDMFKNMDADGVYRYLDQTPHEKLDLKSECKQKTWLGLARRGVVAAVRALLTERKRYEYENWYFDNLHQRKTP